VIHRTFRSLDEAPKLVGFTVRQWAALIAGSGLLLGVIDLAHVPTKPAITLCVFVIGLPAAMTYVSESGGLQLSVLLRSMWGWRFSVHTLSACAAGEPLRARGVVILAEHEQLAVPSGESSPEPLEDVAWERWG
jgi:hypothetical protein